MTFAGRRFAFVIGIVIAFALPKRIEEPYGRCTDYEIEPLGFYLLEQVFHGNVGFNYSSGRDCL